jgi:hypothetical protein
VEVSEEVRWKSILVPEISSEDAKEVAEISLIVDTPAGGILRLTQDEKQDATLRIRVQLPMEARTKVGVLQEISRQNMKVERLIFRNSAVTPGDVTENVNGEDGRSSEANENPENFKVVLSGEVDGPDAAISALAYLVRLGYVSLKPAPCLTCGSSCCWDHNLSGRLQVLIGSSALLSTESLNKRSLWKKAMGKLICWLRPEVVSQMRTKSYDDEITDNFERMPLRNTSAKEPVFDPAALYDAIQPSL